MDINDPKVRETFHAALLSFPDNGKPPEGFGTEEGMVTLAMLEYGLLKRHDQTKPCRECGTPRPDYSYMKITPAGRLFMGAMGDRM